MHVAALASAWISIVDPLTAQLNLEVSAMIPGINIWLLLATLLAWTACLVHTMVGDREIKSLLGLRSVHESTSLQETWTMARCGWHWISADLLGSSVVLTMITFTDLISQKDGVLLVIAGFFFIQALAWLLSIAISKPFRNNFLRLGQWMLLATLGVLTLLGRNNLN